MEPNSGVRWRSPITEPVDPPVDPPASPPVDPPVDPPVNPHPTGPAPAETNTTPHAAPQPPAISRSMATKNEALIDAITVKARLPPCEIGAVELLTFFPHHTQWPEAGLRLYRNGWDHTEVARIQLHAQNTLDQESYTKRYDALKHQILKNGSVFFNIAGFKPSVNRNLLTPVTSYHASNYAPRQEHASLLVDATLEDIARGVENWPTGQDCGIVTQAIAYAYRNNLGQYTAADIPHLALQMGFTAPTEASTGQWDQNARQRVEQIAGPVPKKPKP